MFDNVDPATAAARYRAIGDSLAEGVIVFDADGGVLACNLRAEAIVGLTEAQMVGRHVDNRRLRLLGEDGLPLPLSRRPDKLTLQTGQVLTGVVVGLQWDDGQLTWISVSTAPWALDESSTMAGVVVTLLDITEHKLARDSLLESEERFRQAFDNAPVGMAIYSPDGRLLSANPWLCRLMGYSEEDLRQLTPEQVTLPTDFSREFNLLGKLLRGELSSVCLEKTLICRDGLRLVVRKNVSVVRNAQARPVTLIGQIEDISGLKEAQSAAFSRSLVAAQEAERKRISHELHDEIGQSLTALKITLGRARKQVSEPSALESLDHAQLIISSLMNEIRGIAHRLRPPELDQLGLVASLRNYLEKTLRAGDLEISFDSNVGERRFSPDIELCCFRVTQEAATNCLRHAGAQRFDVELKFAAGRLTLTIRDDGAGFDLAARKDGGTLGLTGMRERVKAAGGKLVINSSPRLGTEIRACFPVHFAETSS